jgi:hypothetical protein
MRSLVLLALAGAACTSPRYGSGHLRCAATGAACPSGFFCAADSRCWRNGDGPDGGGGSSADLATGGAIDLGSVPSRCAATKVLLCDGFEANGFDPQWQLYQKLGTVALDGTRAYRGHASVHMQSSATSAGMQPSDTLFEMRTFPVANGATIYVRVFAWFAGPLPTAANITLVNLIDAASGGVELDSEGAHPAFNDNGTPSSFATSASLFPTDRWICLQMSMPQGAATGDVHMFIDGAELTDARLTGATITQITGVYLGLDYYRPPALPVVDAWYDELIIDDKPITCDQ